MREPIAGKPTRIGDSIGGDPVRIDGPANGQPVPLGSTVSGTPASLDEPTVVSPVAYPVLYVDVEGTQWFDGRGPPPRTGIAGARIGDYYIDDDTGLVYELRE